MDMRHFVGLANGMASLMHLQLPRVYIWGPNLSWTNWGKLDN